MKPTNDKASKRRQRYLQKEIMPNGRAYILTLILTTRTRAKKKNIYFDLCFEDIAMPLVCPILNIKFQVGRETWYNSPSIDRIDNTQGYTKDNIIIVSMMANSIKNQATPLQIRQVADFYENLYKERNEKS